MKRSERNRLVISAGWLLTPIVVWAASFFGGWAGAQVGESIGFLVGGGVVFGALVLAAWILAIRWLTKRSKRRPPGDARRE